MRQHPGEEGVSEVVGVMLLIGVTVLAVAIVAVPFLSAPQPDEIPHAAIVTGNTSGKLVLAHEGGDSLRAGEYRIYIDTGSGLVERTSDFSEPEGGIWSIGESINYTGTETPRRVVVTVISGGSETILSEPAFVGGGSTFSPDPVEPDEGDGDDDEPEIPFIDYVVNENVFVYGNMSQFNNGVNVYGPGATIVITGDVKEGYFKSITTIDVSKVYIKGDCYLKDVNIGGDVYVGGNLTLYWTPQIADDARIYYAGKFDHPKTMSPAILDKCIRSEVTIPDLEMPPTKPASWYTEREYDPGGALEDNKKIFASSYTSTSGISASDVIIIAYDGDILITGGWSAVTGVFFAPKGKVTFNGGSLEGVVIARDGFFATHDGSTVTFRNIKEYISNPEDYPF